MFCLHCECTQIKADLYTVIIKKIMRLKHTLGVDRLTAPKLSILPIIDIGHFQKRFADNFFFLLLFFFIMQTNILFTGDIIYW